MKKGKIRRLLSITLLGAMLASSVVQAAPLSDTAENESLEYLAYYPLTEDVQDHSGNEMAQNAELKGTGAEFKDGACIFLEEQQAAVPAMWNFQRECSTDRIH